MPKDTEVTFLNLIEQADAKTFPIVAVVPITSNTETTLSQWGTASRVVRVVQKPVRSAHYTRQPSLVVLHGLTRVHVLDDKNKNKDLTQSGSLNSLDTPLPILPVEYAPTEKVPSQEAVNEFKQSALRMLDRLGKDDSVLQTSKHEGYAKIAEMVEEITSERVLWLVDILVANINVDYYDKLGEFYPPLYSFIITFVFWKVSYVHPTLMHVSTSPPKCFSKLPPYTKYPKRLLVLSMSHSQTNRKYSFSGNRWWPYSVNYMRFSVLMQVQVQKQGGKWVGVRTMGQEMS